MRTGGFFDGNSYPDSLSTERDGNSYHLRSLPQKDFSLAITSFDGQEMWVMPSVVEPAASHSFPDLPFILSAKIILSICLNLRIRTDSRRSLKKCKISCMYCLISWVFWNCFFEKQFQSIFSAYLLTLLFTVNRTRGICLWELLSGVHC